MMDKDFELKGEAAERAQPKKLTAADIPEGYRYAAVDASGNGFAYQCKPKQLNTLWVNNDDMDHVPIGSFDATDWQNSLVSRETAERPQPKKLTAADIFDGYRYAAIDVDGFAFAYKDPPELFDRFWDSSYESKCKYLDHKVFIGKEYNKTDWRNSLVSRETAERPELKKLTAADIPDGYNYAAVDEDGEAFAYQEHPIIIVTCWKGTCKNPKLLGDNFYASDWRNSLVSRENIETETAYKETNNKLSYSEIDPYFLQAMARRMNEGKQKYGPNNWKKLSDINELLDAAQRHLLELRKMMQEDFEPIPGQETDLQHCAALACNAMFIHYHLNPST